MVGSCERDGDWPSASRCSAEKFASDPSGVLLGLEDHDFRVSEIRKVLQQASRDDISDAFAEWSNSDRSDMVFRILGCASDELAMAQLLDSLPIEQRRNFYTLLWSRFSDLNLEDALLQAEGRGESEGLDNDHLHRSVNS